MHMFPNERG